jgi:hypothetical protein
LRLGRCLVIPIGTCFELIAIRRAATANLQARMAKVHLGQDYPQRGKLAGLGDHGRPIALSVRALPPSPGSTPWLYSMP